MLLPFFEWCEGSALGTIIRESLWGFAVIESIHLVALSLIGGALLIVDLRLLGVGLRRYSVAEIGRSAQPWLLLSLGVMVVTGITLFSSESVKCYYNAPFWVKMTMLPLAVLFTFTVRHRVVRAEEGRIGPVLSKLTALVSLSLWFSVGAAGRLIGFWG
jgi:hypothetical protein